MAIKIKHWDEDIIPFFAAGAQTVGEKLRWVAPFAGRVCQVKARLGTGGGTGSTQLVDVNINGVSVFATLANRLTIPITDTTLKTVEATAMDGPRNFAAGDVVTIDVDQIHTAAGSNLAGFVVVKKNKLGPHVEIGG